MKSILEKSSTRSIPNYTVCFNFLHPIKSETPPRLAGFFVLSKQSITTTYTFGAAARISSPHPEAYFSKFFINKEANVFAFSM